MPDIARAGYLCTKQGKGNKCLSHKLRAPLDGDTTLRASGQVSARGPGLQLRSERQLRAAVVGAARADARPASAPVMDERVVLVCEWLATASGRMLRQRNLSTHTPEQSWSRGVHGAAGRRTPARPSARVEVACPLGLMDLEPMIQQLIWAGALVPQLLPGHLQLSSRDHVGSHLWSVPLGQNRRPTTKHK